MKPKLGINQKQFDNPSGTLGMKELLSYLIDSDLFDIYFHSDKIGVTKGMRATVIHYNDKKVYLDLWEYTLPSYSVEVYDANCDLIIKLQHKPDNDRLERFCQRKKILIKRTAQERQEYVDKFTPWTFFPSKMMQQHMGHEEELEPLPIEQIGFFCGKGWKSRCQMKLHLQDLGVEYHDSNQGMRRGRPLDDEQYLNKMRTSKYGIVLGGRGTFLTEAKNRREIDYMMLKKPLLINYKPSYYNKLVNGKHYIYINEKTELDKLEDMYNIDEIAQNGYEWYKENATPMGAANVFLQMMKDKFGE